MNSNKEMQGNYIFNYVLSGIFFFLMCEKYYIRLQKGWLFESIPGKRCSDDLEHILWNWISISQGLV